MFSKLYERVLAWSRHPSAVWYLGAVSFAESSFFPIPPDVLLAPMVLAQPRRAWKLAAWTTLTSVLGGVAGFTLGAVAIDALRPFLQDHGYWESYLRAGEWFATWGFWAVFLAGFSPIPYKVFTITAGALAMPLLPFLIASTIGRGARFFLVAALLSWGGPRMESMLRGYVERLGWVMVALAVGAYIALKA